MLITKQANGLYRWYGYPTNNALDRDREILSARALEADVARTKQFGDDSYLYLFHIPYAFGGAPDFRMVIDGFLVESGEFYDTPEAAGMAEYVKSHPEGLDGSGWGMSLGFLGEPDRSGVYHQAIVRERSVLPLSRAANPFTLFGVGVQKMLTKEQQAALDTVLGDPTLVNVVKTALQAKEKSGALDEQGVTRKSVGATVEPVVKSEGGVLGAFLEMGGMTVKADGAPVEGDKPTDTPADGATPDMPMEQKQPEAAPADAAPAAAAPEEPQAAPSGDVAGAIAEQIAVPVAEAVAAGVEAVQETASTFTPEQSQQIVDLVNAAVAPIQQALQEMAQSMASISASNTEMAKQVKEYSVIKSRNEQPKRNTLLDVWNQRASQSKGTALTEDDPLKNKALALPESPAPGAGSVWQMMGFEQTGT